MTSKVYNWIRSHKETMTIDNLKLYDGLAIYNISDIIFYRDYVDVMYKAYPDNKCTRKTKYIIVVFRILTTYLNEQL